MGETVKRPAARRSLRPFAVPFAAARVAALLLLLGLIALSAPAVAQAPKTLEEVIALPHHEQKPLLDEIVKKTPSSAEAHFQLGIWYYEEGRFADALEKFKKTLSLDPGSFKALANASLALSDLGRSSEALALFEDFVAKNPKDASAIAYYGEALWGAGRKSEALDNYRKALSIDAKCPEAHFNMGAAFAEMGIFREAIREWQEVVVIGHPQHLVSQAKENISRAEGKL